MANMHYQATVKATGKAYWYACKRNWHVKAYSVDFGDTWHKNLTDARKAGEASGKISWVRPGEEHKHECVTFLSRAKAA